MFKLMARPSECFKLEIMSILYVFYSDFSKYKMLKMYFATKQHMVSKIFKVRLLIGDIIIKYISDLILF